jgi:hypothetical protein
VLRVASPSLYTNRAFHRMLRDGCARWNTAGLMAALPETTCKIVHFVHADSKRLVCREPVRRHRRATPTAGPISWCSSIGLPLGLIELKNAADEDTTRMERLTRSCKLISQKFLPCCTSMRVLVASEWLAGAHWFADRQPGIWFKVWREIDSDSPLPSPGAFGHPLPPGAELGVRAHAEQN